jgi:hypothetical protein
MLKSFAGGGGCGYFNDVEQTLRMQRKAQVRFLHPDYRVSSGAKAHRQAPFPIFPGEFLSKLCQGTT